MHIIAWIKSFFSSPIGILFKIILKSAANKIIDDLKNKDFQQKALEFVRELNKRDDISNLVKAELFNKKMWEYAKSVGRELSECVINCLRELAVTAAKVEDN